MPAPSVPIDARAYIDETGIKGYVRKADPKEFGLLLGVVVKTADEAALRVTLQPAFDTFRAALPLGSKVHLREAFGSKDEALVTAGREARRSFIDIAKDSPLTVVYEAIGASVFVRRRQDLENLKARAEAARISGITITTHEEPALLEEEILPGFLLKLDAYAEDSDMLHIDPVSDVLSEGVLAAYDAILRKSRSASHQTYLVAGWDPATGAKLAGAVQTHAVVPPGSGYEPGVTRIGDIRIDASLDPLLLLADILAGDLRYHLRTTLSPQTDPLNAPRSIKGWVLEHKVYGATADYAADVF